MKTTELCMLKLVAAIEREGAVPHELATAIALSLDHARTCPDFLRYYGAQMVRHINEVIRVSIQ